MLERPSFPPAEANSRLPDLIYGTATGLFCVGVKALWAIGLVIATRSTGSGPGSLDMGRMAVWGFLAMPVITYVSLFASFGASALWTGTPAGRWFGRPELRGLFVPLPPEQITFLRCAGRGALGGLVALASLSILLVASFVLCLAMVFFGPGLPMLLLWLGVVMGAAVACLLWGGVIGSLIFLRRRWGWPAGITVSITAILICNWVIGKII